MCKQFQTIGFIQKEDNLKPLNFSVIDNTIVLETSNPFPGYHSEIIEKGKPRTVYFIIKQPMVREDIARLYKELSSKLDFAFHFTISKLILNHQSLNAVRVHGIESYNNVYELQKELAENFVPFMKGKSRGGEAIIKTSKQFNLSLNENGLFESNTNPDISYFIVPKNILWDDFKEMTLKIKHSWDLVNFDAAQGILFIDNCIQDVVRIYSKEAKTKDILEIIEKYLNKY